MLTALPGGQPGPSEDWMHVSIQAPAEVGAEVLKFLHDRFGFRDVDWCVMERREDYSRIDYDPVPARTRADYDYTIDWRDTPPATGEEGS